MTADPAADHDVEIGRDGMGFVVRRCFTCGRIFLNDDDHTAWAARHQEAS